MIRTPPVLFLAIFLVLLLLSCSGADPSITDLRWRVVYRIDGERRSEELNVFFLPMDPDGVEDLDRAEVIAGQSALRWRIQRENWTEGRDSLRAWMGLPPLVPPEDGPLPQGLYTLVLLDRAGRESTRTFRPDPDRPPLEDLEWPDVRLDDDRFRIGALPAGAGEVWLTLRGVDGGLTSSFQIVDGQEFTPGEAATWEVWIPLDDVSRGYRIGPIEL